METDQDSYWMEHALACARQAQIRGEVPVGAVLVKNGALLAQAGNFSVGAHDASAHAEILVLREGGRVVGNYRLVDTTLYVTLEPCMMCAGAMIHARIKRLVFGACDPKTGAIQSRLQLLGSDFVNHRVIWRGGVLEDSCKSLLQAFFRERR